MKATLQPRQSALDVALQYFGSPEAVFLVADRLGVEDFTQPIRPGATFEYEESEVIDRHVADYYKNNSITPTTEIESDNANRKRV